ncbi:hypothetical protein A3C87_00320 [Candidatus Kaiserbacteria bacterium RIFCSPHIGHO2_02_FULL_49_34]|uniref:Methylated-DNA-[protein]-cysteine S-methyltransferase DNA binding domain-containing protein n=1 Tax=Candidatus Kaiserbacteria bacterium RIFCSPHIGHO2_02_FULL_49_34 TaxID=1798491 RepID=A0A1F6DK76_9BACT|nr:MAG: hypothetical protein A3C87_00320 [Candidatus Kaiserbacteria bacterium RIFCSPHIGHO2_02_FULL_49_34]
MKNIAPRGFSESVLKIVRAIPAGETLSYGEVALLAGFPGAARAVGSLLRQNADMNVPCHRVILASGKMGAYNGLRGMSKTELLEEERASSSETDF